MWRIFAVVIYCVGLIVIVETQILTSVGTMLVEDLEMMDHHGVVRQEAMDFVEWVIIVVVDLLVATLFVGKFEKYPSIRKSSRRNSIFNWASDARQSSDRDDGDRRNGGGDRFSSNKNQQQPGERLRRVKWEDYSLTEFQKNFYSPCESVLLRTPQEIERFQRKNEITTKGRDVPPPLLEFFEGKFPEYAMREIAKAGFEKPTAIQAQSKFHSNLIISL